MVLAVPLLLPPQAESMETAIKERSVRRIGREAYANAAREYAERFRSMAERGDKHREKTVTG